VPNKKKAAISRKMAAKAERLEKKTGDIIQI
jgi:hypothetical protein